MVIQSWFISTKISVYLQLFKINVKLIIKSHINIIRVQRLMYHYNVNLVVQKSVIIMRIWNDLVRMLVIVRREYLKEHGIPVMRSCGTESHSQTAWLPHPNTGAHRARTHSHPCVLLHVTTFLVAQLWHSNFHLKYYLSQFQTKIYLPRIVREYKMNREFRVKILKNPIE